MEYIYPVVFGVDWDRVREDKHGQRVVRKKGGKRGGKKR